MSLGGLSRHQRARHQQGRIATLACATALVAIPVATWASGGGGMGGGMGMGGGVPSVQAPSYDPVEEYRNGVAQLQDGKYRDAERSFDHVLEVAPQNADALFMMGMAQSGRGDLKAAARSYEKAVRVDPQQIQAVRELAITDAKLGQADKAQAQLATLKTRADKCADTCPEAADLKAAMGAVEAAMASPNAPATVKPSSLLLTDPAHGDHSYVQAVRLINEHRYQDALVSLREASAVFGPHPDILTYTGYTYRKLHQYDQAEFYYRQALAIAPNHVGATEYYGELMAVRGDIAGAKHMLSRLEGICTFGCVEVEDLRRWIETPPPHAS
jgi:tetratricopeptide (TPR) repeat protein